MFIFRNSEDINQYISLLKNKNEKIGFVPTMGALHAGHISLIKAALKNNNTVIASIFVNPTQFNNAVDLAKYPKTLEKDILMLQKAGCHALMIPSIKGIYPQGTHSATYNLNEADMILEGEFRPGHFQGVAQVVDRLLRITHPDFLYLGQKDLQQILVIKQIVNQLHKNTKIEVIETMRESDGLAMSSRNVRLNEQARSAAPIIYKMLSLIEENRKAQTFRQLKETALENLMASGFEHIDYLALVDYNTFTLMDHFDEEKKMYLLFAGTIDGVRLIDNIAIN